MAKVPHTRRWRATTYGRRIMGSAFYLQRLHFSHLYSGATA
jgi:hypothetical protein